MHNGGIFMKLKDILMLFGLAALWGASFLFMRIGAPVLGPFVLIFFRVSIASVALLIYLIIRHQRLSILQKWKQYLLLGLLNAAIPFTLISTAELHLTASLASILNATTPLFAALVAWIWMKEALTIKKVVGLILGVIGVSVLVGWDPYHSGEHHLIWVSFSLVAALLYAFAGVYSSRAFKGEKPMDMAIGQQLGASMIMIPFAGATIPQVNPSAIVISAVLGLAVLCTAVAYLLYFALIRNVGPVKTLSVTFLIPIFGIIWSALFLGEGVTLNIVVGLVIILLSVALVMNIPFFRRKDALELEATTK
jgi:drug/metabolite transporter (DMT)-like permease